MTPGWVTGLDDYWVWCEERLEWSGGVLENNALVVEFVLDPVEDVPRALLADRQRLVFHDGCFLDFSFLVDDQLELIEYKFHYALADNTLVWRQDKHAGHQAEDGTDVHVHLPDGRREPTSAVDLEDVLVKITHVECPPRPATS